MTISPIHGAVSAALLSVAMLPLASCQSLAGGATASETAAPAVAELFNGRDLAGWVNVNTSPTTWTVAQDEAGAPVIKCTGQPTGILRTEKAYENFVLEFDWKHLSYPGNAGLFVWSDPVCAKGVPFSRSIEVQIMLT
ncbi:MAG: 3-keto-disaccharide hydrolase, partial [Phycisphaerales bacterium]